MRERRIIARDAFPFLLRQIPSLPKTLDVVGEIPPDETKFLCVVGARRHSPYGRDACVSLIAGLRGYPVAIVSGLAIGIDSIAHEAAMSAGLRTVAFPGSGLSPGALYPASRRRLAEEIVASGGALVSPFKPDDPAAPWFFPARNRLMAGMCHATLIIEAREDSGTMITADAALEFGRDVLAVPGSIFSEMSRGPNKLFSQGAAPAASSTDILEALGLIEPQLPGLAGSTEGRASKSAAAPTRQAPLFDLSPLHKRILNALEGSDGETSSSLISELGVSAPDFSAAMTELELSGLASTAGGKHRIHRSASL